MWDMRNGLEENDFDIALTAAELSMLGNSVHKQEDLELSRDADQDVDQDVAKDVSVSLLENRRLRLRLYYVVGAKTAREGLTRVTSDRVGRERLESMLSEFDYVSGLDMTNVSVNDLGELDRSRSERYGLRKDERLYEIEYTYEIDVSMFGIEFPGDEMSNFELRLTHRLMEWMVDEGAVAVWDWVVVGRLS